MKNNKGLFMDTSDTQIFSNVDFPYKPIQANKYKLRVKSIKQ